MEPTCETSLPEFDGNWAFFLDVDGTLLELASRPDAVVIKPMLLETLENLYSVTNGAIAFISGRSLIDLDKLFVPLQLPAAGQHGLERRDINGKKHQHALPDGRFDELKAALTEFAENHSGVLIEDKGITIAIHYRLAPEYESEIKTLLNTFMDDLAADFILQRGKMMLEVRPCGKDKGTAINEFMQEQPFINRHPVFIGDDITDEDGFIMVNSLGGDAIKVGAGPTSAGWRLPDSSSVLEWLQAYTRYVGSTNEKI